MHGTHCWLRPDQRKQGGARGEISLVTEVLKVNEGSWDDRLVGLNGNNNDGNFWRRVWDKLGQNDHVRVITTAHGMLLQPTFVKFHATLRASLSGTFLQTLPDLVTLLKGYSFSPRSCPPTRSAPSERFGYWSHSEHRFPAPSSKGRMS